MMKKMMAGLLASCMLLERGSGICGRDRGCSTG